MAKEIDEQPDSVFATFAAAAFMTRRALSWPDLGLSDADIANIQRVVMIGMGTSLPRACVGRTYIEQLAGLPAEVDNASEYRYRHPILDSSHPGAGHRPVRRDGRYAGGDGGGKRLGAKVIAVCNTPGSQATRLAHGTVYLRCGPEVAVASTKTFLGSHRGAVPAGLPPGAPAWVMDEARLGDALTDLARMPGLIGEALKAEPAVQALARRYFESEHFLFLGRGLQYPVAMEGALKLKEVSYIHAEGYSAGEMKHGPIALIDERMPVVAIARAGRALRQDVQQHRGGTGPRRRRHRHRHRRRYARWASGPMT